MNTIEDRKRGVMAGLAIGDALGAGYEFGPALPKDEPIYMKGGGPFNWNPGQWTDDTSMAYPIAMAVAEGKDLQKYSTITSIYQTWRHWSVTAPDVGNQTRTILSQADSPTEAETLTRLLYNRRPFSSGGNGCVMRTAPIALGYLHDPVKGANAAYLYAALTHGHPDAAQATARWTMGLIYALNTGEFPKWLFMGRKDPLDYTETNGSAWDAVNCAVASIQEGFGEVKASLEIAVRAGGDTDTVAAIAGGMLGAVHGFSGMPEEWLSVAHGWPGIYLEELPTVAK